jgi:hypothetical protein
MAGVSMLRMKLIGLMVVFPWCSSVADLGLFDIGAAFRRLVSEIAISLLLPGTISSWLFEDAERGAR